MSEHELSNYGANAIIGGFFTSIEEVTMTHENCSYRMSSATASKFQDWQQNTVRYRWIS